MSEPVIDLDPREVLDHLRALGYNHITKDQLKQFIKDLKKLIKYDLRKVQAKENLLKENELPCSSNCRSRLFGETDSANTGRNVLRDKNQAEKPLVECRSKSVAVQTLVAPNDVVCSSSGSFAAQQRSPSSKSDVSRAMSISSCSTCKAAVCSCMSSKPQSKSSNKKENSVPKPVSSFIRVTPSELKVGKTDPVTLYHYYQSVWAKQNRPGENPHSDVRWRIRHKMMAPTVMKTNLDNRRENPPWVE